MVSLKKTKEKLLYFYLPLSYHPGVRVVGSARRARAPSAWRGSAPSVAQRARSAPARQPRPSPALRHANTPTGATDPNSLARHTPDAFCLRFSETPFACLLPIAACRTTSRRAAATPWTARPPRTPPATAPVPSRSSASSRAAIRTASPVSPASPRRRSPASQLFARWRCLQ